MNILLHFGEYTALYIYISRIFLFTIVVIAALVTLDATSGIYGALTEPK